MRRLATMPYVKDNDFIINKLAARSLAECIQENRWLQWTIWATVDLPHA